MQMRLLTQIPGMTLAVMLTLIERKGAGGRTPLTAQGTKTDRDLEGDWA